MWNLEDFDVLGVTLLDVGGAIGSRFWQLRCSELDYETPSDLFRRVAAAFFDEL